MSVILVPTHIPGANNAIQFSNLTHRGECQNSASLDTITNSFSWSVQLKPDAPRMGLLSRGDTSGTDWTLYVKLINGGKVEVGLQDVNNAKIVFKSTASVFTDDPVELTIIWDFVTKTLAISKNAAPVGVVLDPSSTTTPSSFSNLYQPTGIRTWYFGYVYGEPLFSGVYYGDVLDNTAWSSTELYEYVSPRVYAGAPNVSSKIVFGSNRNKVSLSNLTRDLFKMSPTGNSVSLLASSTKDFMVGKTNVTSKQTLVFDKDPNENPGETYLSIVGISGGLQHQYRDPGSNLLRVYARPCWINENFYMISNYDSTLYAVPYWISPVRNTIWDSSLSGVINQPTSAAGVFFPGLAPSGGYVINNPLYRAATGVVRISAPGESAKYAAIIPNLAGVYNLLILEDSNSSTNGDPNSNGIYPNGLSIASPVLSVVDSVSITTNSYITDIDAHVAAQKLVYVKAINNVANIYTADLPFGTNINQISFAGDCFSPVFSPDGTKIAFTQVISGKGQIMVCNLDGSNLQSLSNNAYNEWVFGWV
jgi:hypothetical protein